jgi:hypothetical protein
MYAAALYLDCKPSHSQKPSFASSTCRQVINSVDVFLMALKDSGVKSPKDGRDGYHLGRYST